MKDSTILIVSLEREDLHVYRLLHTLMLAKVCLKNLSTTSLNYFYGLCRPPPYKYYFGKVKHNKMQNAIDATSPHSGGATPI